MASADPLLTTLCSVCRTNPPRYKCPRCNIPYCSVPCNHRHRARAGCSGIRDVTTFVPRARLCTAAGIDRDYNFLQGIDVARNSAVKHVVDERRVLRAHDVRARVLNEEDPAEGGSSNRKTHDRKKDPRAHHNGPALVKQWDGEEVVYIPARPRLTGAAAAAAAAAVAAAAAQNEDDDEDEPTSNPDASPATTIPVYEAATSHRVRALCRRDGIELLGAPRGFARQRENNTTVATATTTSKDGGRVSNVHLHWQVEWLVYTSSEAAPTRVLRRSLDDTPLYRAYTALQAAERKKQGVALVNEVEEADDDDGMDTRGDGEAAGPSQSKSAQGPNKSKKQKQQQQQQSSKKGQQPASRLPPTPTAPFHNAFFYTYDAQDSATAAWHTRTMKDDDAEEQEEAEAHDDPAHLAARHNFSYYLLRPRVSGVAHHAQAKELIPLDATDTLATALLGRSVLEFPIIYVLPKEDALPTGYALGSTERRAIVAPSPPPPAAGKQGKKPNGFLKRRQNGGPDTPAAKKRKTADGEEEEDGEHADIDAAGAATELESDTSSSGSDSSDEEDDESEEEEDEEEGSKEPAVTGADGRLPELLRALGSTGSMPADGKPKLVVYDSWSEGSDGE